METEIIKSFMVDKIHNEKQRIFKCWGSVEVKDRHGEIIPAEEIYKIMDIWMDRGSPIQFNHTNRKVGVGLNWQSLEKNGKPGVLITAKIYDHYAEDDDIWNGIKKGDFEGLSIGGKSYKRETTEEGTFLRGLIGYEFSVVERCGNQEATFETINMLAKTEEKMVDKKEIKKEENMVVDEAPVTEAPERDFKEETMALFAKIGERLDAIEEKISGGASEETPVEEQKEEEPEEEEKMEDEESEMAKELKEIKKSLAEIRKSIVKEVIKTERPAQPEVKKEGEDVMKTIDNKIEEMKKSGKFSFAEVGAEIRKAQEKELARKFA